MVWCAMTTSDKYKFMSDVVCFMSDIKKSKSVVDFPDVPRLFSGIKFVNELCQIYCVVLRFLLYLYDFLSKS